MSLKIAVPTDDGITISGHFGQAAYFKVVEVEAGEIKSSEIRKKAIHHHGVEGGGAPHPGAQMIQSISDCQVLIAGGMGSPAYQRAVQAGLKVILTRQQDIDLAIQAYQAGNLVNDPALVHTH